MRAFCVCVPALNEVERLPILLSALADQTVEGTLPVALCVNNSDDGSADAARETAARFPNRIALHCEERVFAPVEAHAGSARRAAMDFGAAILPTDDAVLISTDADCRPPPQWIGMILAAIDNDLIVGGRIVLDDAEAVSPEVGELRARFDRYWENVRAIEDEFDPRPWDKAPRHGDHTGASLALTTGLYRRAGGVPLLRTGEDRALVDAAIAVGGRLVHPECVWTRASARTVGRADGGMAVDMHQLSVAAEGRLAPLVPSFDQWRDRALWRREARAAHRSEHAVAASERLLRAMRCDMPLPVEDHR